jgi:ABC-type transport system substrate-binding protein
MRLSVYRSVAIVSALSAIAPLYAARRPRYGGTLRVEMRAAVQSLDPAEWPLAAPDPASRERLASLVVEPLVRIGESGRAEPALAVSWKHDAEYKRWQFRLRSGVKFHDGSPLDPTAAAAALNAGELRASPTEDGVVIQTGQPMPALLAELADLRHAIVIRTADRGLIGTGPFRIAQWDAGRRALFNANEDYWDGRPFLDAIAVEMGRTTREQALDLEFGRADFVETGPNELRRLMQGGFKTWSSAASNLLAIEFERGRPAAADARVREAIALSVDRAAIHNVLLQKEGETASGLLPEWLGGYAFLFSNARDVARARQQASAVTTLQPLTLAYDATDPVLRAIAERVALDAREAGLRVQASAQAAHPDLRLVRVALHSADPADALRHLAEALGLAGSDAAQAPETPEALYAAERAFLEEFRAIPLVHLPDTYAGTRAIGAWRTSGVLKSGNWRLDDLWMGARP